MKTISIELTDDEIDEVNTDWWRQIMSLFMKPGRAFEIRHWREENELVEKASAYGTVSEAASTDFEVSIKGTLTSSVIHEILNTVPSHQAHQMTSFFTINVVDTVSSSHYGTEMYIFHPSEEICRQLSEILEPVKEYFTFGEYGE